MFNLQVTEDIITVDNETEEKKNVIIELIDYDDDVYDIHFLNLKNNSLFGKSALCGIHGLERAQEILSKLLIQTGLTYRIVKGNNMDTMLYNPRML